MLHAGLGDHRPASTKQLANFMRIRIKSVTSDAEGWHPQHNKAAGWPGSLQLSKAASSEYKKYDITFQKEYDI